MNAVNVVPRFISILCIVATNAQSVVMDFDINFVDLFRIFVWMSGAVLLFVVMTKVTQAIERRFKKKDDK